MKTIRYKSGPRKGDPDRYAYAFFVLGAMVVIAVVFFIGFQVGRAVERNAAAERVRPKETLQKKADIRKELSSYSEEAVAIPVVAPPQAPPPPDAGEELRKVEEAATFPESLTRKDPAPQPLVKPKTTPPSEAKRKPRYMLQAGALRSREAAESLRGKLEKGGFRSRVVHIDGKGRGGDLYKVRIGPHGSREEALKTMRAIKAEMKVDAILLKD